MTAPGWPAYDAPEQAILDRMKRILAEEDGIESAELDGLSFTDVESMFLDDYGHEDFRPADGDDR